MGTYSYLAREVTSGNKLRGEIQADTENNAAKILVSKGLAPLEIKPQQSSPGFFSRRSRIPSKARVIFSRQLSTMISSGLPLVQSLSTVKEQTPNASLKSIIAQVIMDIEGGSTLADAMGKYPRVFDDVYVSLIAAGEASGTLDVSLDRLAIQQEKDAEIVSSIRGALLYPVIVLLVLLGVVVFMMVSVLPQVQSLYSSLPGTKLPLLTTMMISLSHFMIHFWWLLILIIISTGILVGRWVRTAAGIITVDKLKMKAPAIGPLFMKLYMARFTRVGATLVASGVPILKMLETSARAVGNIHVERSIAAAAEEVKGGKALSDTLQKDSNFLSLVPSMIHIGEQSGTLDTMLGKVADYYEKELDGQIKSISTTIEPVLMIVVGVIALIIVAAVLLPIYSLAGKNVIH
jgi:type IV pilus assembly protein PilC